MEISDLDPEISVLNPGLGVFRDMDITPITDTCHGGWSVVLVVMDQESRTSMTVYSQIFFHFVLYFFLQLILELELRL